MFFRRGNTGNEQGKEATVVSVDGLDSLDSLDDDVEAVPLPEFVAVPIEWDRTERVSRLQQAVVSFRASATDRVLSARKMINPLLDLWGMAASIDRGTAAPIEELLTALVGRSFTSPEEIGASLDAVEAVVHNLVLV